MRQFMRNGVFCKDYVDYGSQELLKAIEKQGEMGCRNCFASADAAAMEKIEAVKKSLGI